MTVKPKARERASHSAARTSANGPAWCGMWIAMKSSPALSHAGANTAPITINTDGDYLFLSTIYDPTDQVQRALYEQGWRVNGGAKSPYGLSGRYSRNTGTEEFGNTSGFIGSGLVANDTVMADPDVDEVIDLSGSLPATPDAGAFWRLRPA